MCQEERFASFPRSQRGTIASCIFDEHSEVLGHWLHRGIRDATVICFDAHLDVQWISAARIARLKNAASPQEAASLAKRHHLAADQGSSYSIEDFFYAASQLNVVRQLVWVTPAFVNLNDSVEALCELAQCDGVCESDLVSFRRVALGDGIGEIISGRLLGIPLTICQSSQIAHLGLDDNCLVDVDIDFFVHLPSERIAPSPDELASWIRELTNQPVTISRSVRSGFTPSRYSELAEWLAASLAGDVERCRRFQRQYETDHWPEHGDAPDILLTRILGVHARRKEVTGPALIETMNHLANQDPRDERTSISYAGLGLLCCEAGLIDFALECYARSEAGLGGAPELALELAKATLQNHVEMAERLLLIAVRNDKTRSGAEVYLAVLRMRQGKAVEAIELLRQATRRVPCWSLPHSLLADALDAAGGASEAMQIRLGIHSLDQRIESHARSLLRV